MLTRLFSLISRAGRTPDVTPTGFQLRRGGTLSLVWGHQSILRSRQLLVCKYWYCIKVSLLFHKYIGWVLESNYIWKWSISFGSNEGTETNIRPDAKLPKFRIRSGILGCSLRCHHFCITFLLIFLELLSAGNEVAPSQSQSTVINPHHNPFQYLLLESMYHQIQCKTKHLCYETIFINGSDFVDNPSGGMTETYNFTSATWIKWLVYV